MSCGVNKHASLMTGFFTARRFDSEWPASFSFFKRSFFCLFFLSNGANILLQKLV